MVGQCGRHLSSSGFNPNNIFPPLTFTCSPSCPNESLSFVWLLATQSLQSFFHCATSFFRSFSAFFASAASFLFAAFTALTAASSAFFSPTRACLQAFLRTALVSWVFEVHGMLDFSSLPLTASSIPSARHLVLAVRDLHMLSSRQWLRQ
jgi:hypothetical protein